MPQQFIPDDTDALREWARSLSSIASLAKARVDDIGSIAATVDQAGQGTAVNAIRSSLKKLQNRLTAASDHLSRGAGALTTLANTLDRLEEDAERKFRSYGSPARATPKWVEYETFGDPWAETNSAHHARSAAAKILQQLADEAPGAEQHEAAWQQFLGHIKNGAVDVCGGVRQGVEDDYHVGKDVVTDLSGEVVGIVKAGWTLGKLSYDVGPVNLLLNHKQWAASWKSFAQSEEYVLTHKKLIAGALWDGLIDKDMWRKDKTAWAIVSVINLVGLKGLGKLSESTRSAKGITGLTKIRDIRQFSGKASLDQMEGTSRHQGHTYARHMLQRGKTSQQFMTEQFHDPALNRYWDRPAGGIFYNKELANQILQKALHDQARKVAKFMKNPKQTSETLFVVSKQPVGTAMARTDVAERTTFKTRIYLVKDLRNYPEGFYVKSMFPEL